MKNVIVLLSVLSFLLVGQNLLAQTTASLNEDETKGILLMLEEEKLARDVYLALDDKWNSTVFSHISNSEQRHYDKMNALAKQFNLAIPASVTNDEKGKFLNKKLQQAYDEMVEIGNVSLENALRIGANVEELDIQDLSEVMAQTENEDILNVYNQLKQASEKHLQSFTKNLSKEGMDYTPSILSQKDFDAIINAKASCQGGKGEAKGCCSKKAKSAKSEKGCGNKKGKKGKKGGACCSS